ncbi:EpsG family protein [Providencia rettgeri]|uniref:EpsG family protein n=1 Tax=Providencia rettgeri TaxID=587 RepID=UPI00235FAC00|nr:EpsG family protein [Providencia rettgeri]
MATIIFYNFILLSSTLFVWLSEKGKRYLDRWILLWVAFLIIFIPSAIRYGIGTDFFNYINIYNHIDNYDWMEGGFYYANLFLKSLDASAQWSLVLFSFIFSFSAFLAYPRKNGWVVHFIFMAMLWFFSLNGIRQGIAASFCLLALLVFLKKSFFYFVLLTLIGALFHKSALFITAAGFLSLIPLGFTLKTKILPLIFIGFTIFTAISVSIITSYIEQILHILGFAKYAGYFSSYHFAMRDYGSGLGVLVKVLFSIYIILNSKPILQLSDKNWILIIITFTYAISAVLANSIIIFDRMAEAFVVSIIVSSYVLLQLPERKKIHQIVLAIFMSYLLLAFIKTSFGIPTSYGDPQLNPYVTIFDE